MFANSREMMRRVRAFGLPAAIAVAVLLAFGAITGATAQTSQEKYRALQSSRSPFNLAASANQVLQANLVQCGLDNTGNVCTNIFNSPTGGGGYWPAGTTNQYIFNSGVQIAGIVGNGGLTCAGATKLFCKGDTTGAYFFDARGTQPQGDPLTQIYNSLDANDIANWPEGAKVTDTAIYNSALIGSKSISDQDTWVQYWDGNPNRISGKSNPMGIKVEQRSLAFNAPAGAENMLFFIYKLTNITNDPTFQSTNNAKFGITLPAGGYTVDSVYAAFAMDPDVSAANAGKNFSNVVLPFNLGFAYEASFEASDFNFSARASLYAPPFLVGPGFVGVKYLRSPINPATHQQVGLTMFFNTRNDAVFPDPVGVKQLWRYLSGHMNGAAGDPACNIANPIQSKLCYLAQDQADTRFEQASGPFSLAPGQSATIVVGYVFAAAVAANGFKPGTQVRPGIASAHPGTPGDSIRQIEKMVGWVATPPAAVRADGTIDESKVQVVPHSLLDHARIAQAIFNNKFLLPRPPDPPPFTLVPGNNQVTVIWQPTPSEKLGDPYFKIASDTTSPLYNPNYRQFDVQGYRILRSTGVSGTYEVLAQFDKKGTVLYDYTGEFDPNYVPETMGSYEDFANNTYGEYPVPVTVGAGPLVEFPSGGRIQDQATGSVIVLRADTLNLTGSGIPFTFVDKGVKNGITYRYLVQAFDLNSLQSGAVSLVSPAQPQQVVPRTSGMQVAQAESVTVSLKGQTKVLSSSAPLPTINAQGQFSGPMPPTNGLVTGDLSVALAQALKPGTQTLLKIDSVVPYSYGAYYYLQLADGSKTSVGGMEFPNIRTTGTTFDLLSTIVTLAADTTKLTGQFKYTPIFAGSIPLTLTVGSPVSFSGVADWVNTLNGKGGPTGGNYFNCNGGATSFAFTCRPKTDDGGSRWFNGTSETRANPTLGRAHGQLTGIDSIFQPIPNENGVSNTFRRFYQATMAAGRAADIVITWNNGQVQSVVDVTHDVPVPFKPTLQASYGFIPDADGDGVISYLDTKHLEFNDLFGGWQTGSLQPLVQQPVVMPVDVTGDGKGDGTGFGLYINAEIYFFRGTPPASGTWTVRSYIGDVERSGSSYTYTDAPIRTPAVPGLVAAVTVNSAASLVASSDLSQIHTVPDPYYVRSQFDLGPGTKTLRFVNLPSQAVIRIFSVDGVLVRLLEHNDIQQGGEEPWDLRNRNNQFVTSGVYFYVVEAAGGKKKVGRFTVIQFAR